MPEDDFGVHRIPEAFDVNFKIRGQAAKAILESRARAPKLLDDGAGTVLPDCREACGEGQRVPPERARDEDFIELLH